MKFYECFTYMYEECSHILEMYFLATEQCSPHISLTVINSRRLLNVHAAIKKESYN